MFKKTLPLIFLAVLCLSDGIPLDSTIDVGRLQAILQENLKSKDADSLYYATRGLTLLKAKIPDICSQIKNAVIDNTNVEQVFYLTNAAAFSKCQNSLSPNIMKTPVSVLDKKDVTISELYYAVYAMKALGKGTVYDKEDGLKNLVALLKKDDNPANYAFVFLLCEHIGCQAWTTTHAEGVLLAADESDSKSLHFEGGLPVTANLLASIIRTYKSQKKSTPFTEVQRYKFAEYLLSRRSVHTAKGAALLLEASMAIADDEPTPIAISLKGKKYVTPESDTIEISISDLIGREYQKLKPEEVIAQSGTRLADDVVVLSKQPLQKKANEPTTFVLNLNKIKSQYGVYKIAISAGAKSSNVNIAVLGEISVESVEIGLGDVDGTTNPKITTVTYPNKMKATEKLHADHMQKLSLKFTVRDKQNKPIAVQQAFVRIGGVGAGADKETIFVAETDSSKVYKVELSVKSLGVHLRESGDYSISLLIGDSAVSNPILWPLGEITFAFPASDNAVGAPVSSPASPGRGPLPEIAHTFRTPEPRPARLLSDIFAAACAAPLLLLLVLWAKIGVNFRNLPLTPTVLFFHGGLGGSLALYGWLWLKLTMFETMRYLLPLAFVTFVSGHRLLRRLAANKTK